MEVTFHFAQTAYDEQAQITRLPESITIPVNNEGRFDLRLSPSTNGLGWVIKASFTAMDGKIYTDYRSMPATGIVDYFACPKVTQLENVRWPNGETPILISDYNKPGGPLQLTDNGTIADSHIPPEFLRVDDPRMPELANYITKTFYFEDQAARNSLAIHFASSTVWEYDHGFSYDPLVVCKEEDGGVLYGSVSYPVGTTKVVVEWDAPTSGTLIVR